jgi:hypothetical protein
VNAIAPLYVLPPTMEYVTVAARAHTSHC